MNLKLSHKFFIANIGIIIALTVTFLSLSYLSNKSLLSNAMNGIDIKAMDSLSTTLSEHYKA